MEISYVNVVVVYEYMCIQMYCRVYSYIYVALDVYLVNNGRTGDPLTTRLGYSKLRIPVEFTYVNQ